MDIESAVKERYQNLEWALDERLRRLLAASEAKVIGHGGIALVWKATVESSSKCTTEARG
jgi:hypothetical protein